MDRAQVMLADQVALDDAVLVTPTVQTPVTAVRVEWTSGELSFKKTSAESAVNPPSTGTWS